MEKPSISQRSPLSPTLWPADAFSLRRCLIFIGSIVAAYAVGLLGAGLGIRLVGAPIRSIGADLQLTSGLLIVQIVAYIPILGAALPLLPFAAHRSIGDIGLRKPTGGDVRAGLLGAVAMYAIVEAAAYVQRFAFGVEGKQEAVQLFGTTHDRSVIAVYVLLAVMIAPFVEEIVFRGFLFNALLRYTPVGVAAVASGILFGLAHYDRESSFTAFVPLACGGIVLATVYYRTGSLAASMLTHGSFNAFNVILVLLAGGKG